MMGQRQRGRLALPAAIVAIIMYANLAWADTPTVLPRPDFHFNGSVGRAFEDSDPPRFPQPVTAPKNAPNIVLILLDDTGFGQYETFGGGIPSPTIDALAREGLRFNRFHTTALCSPTRAALITGRNHHSAAFASITEGTPASTSRVVARRSKLPLHLPVETDAIVVGQG